MSDRPIVVLHVRDRASSGLDAPAGATVPVEGLDAGLARLRRGGISVVLLEGADPEAVRRVAAEAPGVPIVAVVRGHDERAELALLREGAAEVVAVERPDRRVAIHTIHRALERQAAFEGRLNRSLAREVFPRTEGERRRLLARLVAAQDQERRRIAGDLHDDPVQVMSALRGRLADLEGSLEDPERRAVVGDIREEVEGAVHRLRTMLFDLHPPALDQGGLAAALRRYLGRDEEIVEVRMRDGLDREPPTDVRLVLYRIAREALSNARKHAYPESLTVELEERDGGYALLVADDGVGFDASEVSGRAGHIGLPTMRERAELAGGWCRVESEPGRGTRVEVWLPAAETRRSSRAGLG